MAAAFVPGVPYRVGPDWLRARPLIARFDSLDARGQRPAAWASLDSLVASSRARGDQGLLLQALVKRGGTRVFREGLAAGRADLEEARGLARARRDTLAEINALRWLAFGLSQDDQRASAAGTWRRVLALARAYGSGSHAGWAEMGLAYLDLEAGRLDLARSGYRRSIARLERAGDAAGVRQARIGLDRVLDREARFDEEIALEREQLRDARASGDRYAEATVLNNLGSSEYLSGDPAEAVEFWRAAVASLREQGRGDEALRGPVYNLAIALTDLGRFDDAADLLERSAADAAAAGRRSDWAEARSQLALVRVGQDRVEEAIAILTEVRARSDSVLAAVRDAATLILARAEYQRSRDEIALGFCEEVLRDPVARADAPLWVEAVGQKLDVLVELKRYREATLAAAAAEREPGARYAHPDWHAALAMAYRGLGQPDSALAAMREALAAREQVRTGRALEYRERASIRGASRDVDYARLVLAAPSVGPMSRRRERAFDALQEATARTLSERVAALRGRTFVPVTLEKLQREVLRPGELLLDLHEGREGSLLFAVTREDFRLAELPGDQQLRERAGRFLDVVRGDDAAARQTAAASIARTYLLPFADLLARHPRVIVCAGARFLPYAMLPASAAGEPVLAAHELAFVPSPTLLAAGRAAPAPPAHGVLAVAGGADRTGARLAGAEAEVRWLERRFAGVDAPLPGSVSDADSIARAMARYRVLHLAGHAEVATQDPWASGILLGRGDQPSAWLRASTIARERLRARLCVLAGCQSVGVPEPGEGALGLSTAFLCAGVSASLCTLWPVDDDATRALVEDFYDALARGETAARALCDAQNRRRADPATRAPRNWAGFVLVGEPTTRVTFEAREPVRRSPAARRPAAGRAGSAPPGASGHGPGPESRS